MFFSIVMEGLDFITLYVALSPGQVDSILGGGMPSDSSRRALEKYWFGQSQPSTDGEVEFSIGKS